MWNKVKKSRDKLFFIRFKMPAIGKFRWYLVQVCHEYTDNPNEKEEANETAETTGKYQVWFQIRHHEDSKNMAVRFCRFWPEIREVRRDDSMGAIIPVAPGKAQAFVRRNRKAYTPYFEEVDLLRDGIVGPFDFQPATEKSRQRPNTIGTAEWKQLESQARQYEIATDDIDEIIPIRTNRLKKRRRKQKQQIYVETSKGKT